MAAPRLLAIAPDGWYADAQFPQQLTDFADAAMRLRGRAAVYLRAHGWALADWQAALGRLPAVPNLLLGVTLPVDAALPDLAEALLDARVDFVHATERDADAGFPAVTPLALSRVLHDPAHTRRRLQLGADWLVLSPVFATPSKPFAVPLGLEAIAQAARAAPGRIIALGGIDAGNAAACLRAGAVGVAVQRAAWHAPEALVRVLSEA